MNFIIKTIIGLIIIGVVALSVGNISSVYAQSFNYAAGIGLARDCPLQSNAVPLIMLWLCFISLLMLIVFFVGLVKYLRNKKDIIKQEKYKKFMVISIIILFYSIIFFILIYGLHNQQDSCPI